MHVCFPADVKKYALHGSLHCLLLNKKDSLMVGDCFRPVTGGVACWVDTLFLQPTLIVTFPMYMYVGHSRGRELNHFMDVHHRAEQRWTFVVKAAVRSFFGGLNIIQNKYLRKYITCQCSNYLLALAWFKVVSL